MVLGMRTKSQRRKALATLPADLYKSFRGIINRIRECPGGTLGMKVLMWVHFARRPLELAELQHALAVEEGDTELDLDNIPSEEALLDCCLGLVVVDKETMTVRFMHYTLAEYFRENINNIERNILNDFPDGYSCIPETCLTYLNFGRLRQHCTSVYSLRDKMKEYIFSKYAALYWGNHVRDNHTNHQPLIKFIQMLVDHENECPPFAIQALFFQIPRKWFSGNRPNVAKKFSGIHVLAYFGLSQNTPLWKMKQYRDLEDDYKRTPLSWAAEYGHESIVQMLLEWDVDINAKDKDGLTPLIWAIIEGHVPIARLLIKRDDLDINTRDQEGQTPLFSAAKLGQEAVVQLLTERGNVNINAKNQDGGTPLYAAAAEGHEASVKLLMEREDIDINVKSKGGWTPLSIAVINAHMPVVRLLIGGDKVDVNVKNNDGQTPLSLAVEEGQEAIVRILIQRDDVDTNAEDKRGRTPLSWAALKGHVEIVRLLIERGDVDMNAGAKRRWVPLSRVAWKRLEVVVR